MEIKGVLEEASKDSSSLYLPKPINIFSILTLICKSSKKPRGIAESNLRILRMLLFYFLPIQNAQHVTDIYLHYLCSKYSPHHSPRFCCCHHNVQAIVSSALSQGGMQIFSSQNMTDNSNNTNQQPGHVYVSKSASAVYTMRQQPLVDKSGGL